MLKNISKRTTAYLAITTCILLPILGCTSAQTDLGLTSDKTSTSIADPTLNNGFNLFTSESARVIKKADQYLNSPVKTITADKAERSLGGLHDFYSEGDYWWPDPDDISAPYIRRDGESNPNNFVEHRLSLMRFSEIVASLTSAYIISSDTTYADKAAQHVSAWFADEKTRMNPSLLYGQAIKGRHSGRSIGIIDTVHLVEVAKSIPFLIEANVFTPEDKNKILAWFSSYLNWLNTHEYGLTEKHHPNNHGVAWSLQAATFARLVNDQSTINWVRQQFKQVYLTEMMDQQGGFPAELARTKPYGYSLFVLDIMAGVAQIASNEQNDLWHFKLADGRGMQLAVEFMRPYILNKNAWPLAPDIQYWNDWPVRQNSIIFAAFAFQKPKYLKAWLPFEADPSEYEVVRNLPIRHPVIWLTKPNDVNYIPLI
ncbi:alginate lyase family protein [Catenovulum adriaticum]|uniref:Alginate lyase family protein n=1 Tax=Catenovulum adriaticum TaxID=2984846 RepID=A0ABY7ASL9_9ALTE|nr:alginate lyase family protein [Catenovulum sp. TS8]WAJ72263.1 alginate lyase family protein [Catenovulum sp. TS8]